MRRVSHASVTCVADKLGPIHRCLFSNEHLRILIRLEGGCGLDNKAAHLVLEPRYNVM